MLVTFKSKATGSLYMFDQHAAPILDLFGKEVKQGIITVEELPEAIEILQEEIARKKIAEAREREEQEKLAKEAEEQRKKEEEEAWMKNEIKDDDPFEDRTPPPPKERHVPFSARAWPFLEMLREALKRECEIVWGV